MIQKSENRPTVSVVVITYNSSKYVLETLESIKRQTYPNLSLIITDDCSTDNTIKLCERWIEKNKERFTETTIVSSVVNMGLSANCNQGDRECKTEWVKSIAGDDVLLPNCIEDNVDFIMTHSDVVFLFSRCECFQKKRGDYVYYLDFSFFNLSQKLQYEKLMFDENCIAAPSIFYNVKKCRALMLLNDERIPLMEDWPKWINALKLGVKFYFLDKTTVLWRKNDQSISGPMFDRPNYWYSKLLFYYLYQRDEFRGKYGDEYVIKMEIDKQMNIYRQYYELRNSWYVRFVFLLNTWWKKISFNIKRFHKFFLG